MKSALLIITIVISSTVFANDKVLLECSDKYNSLRVIVESGQINILRNPWDRSLMYVDRKDQTEENPIIVHGYENLKYSALLSNAIAIVNGSTIEITFEDKKATKLKIVVGKIKEGQNVSIISDNRELTKSILDALSVTDSTDLSFYSSSDEACSFIK